MSPSTGVQGVHEVSEGDTFYGISEQWQVPVTALSEANPSIDARALQVRTDLFSRIQQGFSC